MNPKASHFSFYNPDYLVFRASLCNPSGIKHIYDGTPGSELLEGQAWVS